MLTIEQLRALSDADRFAYLRQINNAMKRDETMAQQARNDERRMREIAITRETRADEARAYFATLEAAGLWPVPPATKETP